MAQVLEINQIDQLAQFRQAVGGTAPADRRGVVLSVAGMAGGLLAALRRRADGSARWSCWTRIGPAGILPLVVRREATKVGPLRVLTFPLHDWGSFYGPIGPDPGPTLAAGLEHVRRTPRDWDILELRWQGAPDTDPLQTQHAMLAAGLSGLSDRLGPRRDGRSRPARGSRTGRRERAPGCGDSATPNGKLAEQGEVSHVRYRPLGKAPATARRAGTCTTPARRSPGEAGRARPPTARRFRTSRCAAFFAKCTKPRPRPAPST